MHADIPWIVNTSQTLCDLIHHSSACSVYTSGTQIWSSLCLQMSQHLAVLGHHQAKWWLKKLPMFVWWLNYIIQNVQQDLTKSRVTAGVNVLWSWWRHQMETFNIFRVNGPLCGEFTGHRWIPLTRASDAELWCFLWSAPEQTVE